MDIHLLNLWVYQFFIVFMILLDEQAAVNALNDCNNRLIDGKNIRIEFSNSTAGNNRGILLI